MVFKKNILIITRWFPNPAEPIKCVFTKTIVDAQSKSKKYSFTVISPVPYFPNIKQPSLKRYTKFRDIPLVEKTPSYKIYHPKYLKLPHPYLKNIEWYPYFLQVLMTIYWEIINFNLMVFICIYVVGFVLFKIGRYFNKKVVLHVHESSMSLDTSRDLNTYKKVFKYIDQLIPVSKFQMGEIVKLDKELAKKCWVIYNGVKIDKEITSFNEHLEETNKTIKLIFVGHLIFRKGLDILLKGLKLLDNHKYKCIRDII